MQSKSDNMEIISQDEVDEVIEETFEQSLSRYQIGLEKSMKDSDFIFDCINLLYYKCHKTNFDRGGSYKDSKKKVAFLKCYNRRIKLRKNWKKLKII